MQVNEILSVAAVPAREAEFPSAPELFAVWFDSTEADGADQEVNLITHDCTVELYAPLIAEGNAARQRILAQLKSRGIHYTTQGWYWLKNISRYQEIIEFTHIEKT